MRLFRPLAPWDSLARPNKDEADRSMRQFKRSQRLGEQIHRDLSSLMEGELSEVSPGMVTFTRVKLSDDLRHARVYYSFLGRPEDRERVGAYLDKEKKRIGHMVGRNLRVRNIPEFDFKFDPSIEEGVRIERLLDEIKSQREQ